MDHPAILGIGTDLARLPVIKGYEAALARAWYAVELQFCFDIYTGTLVVEFFHDTGRGIDVLKAAVEAAYETLSVKCLDGDPAPRKFITLSDGYGERLLCADEEELGVEWLGELVVSATIVSYMDCSAEEPRSAKDPALIHGTLSQELLVFLAETAARGFYVTSTYPSLRAGHDLETQLWGYLDGKSWGLHVEALKRGYVKRTRRMFRLSKTGKDLVKRKGLGKIVGYYFFNCWPSRLITGPEGSFAAAMLNDGGYWSLNPATLIKLGLPSDKNEHDEAVSKIIENSHNHQREVITGFEKLLEPRRISCAARSALASDHQKEKVAQVD